MKRFLEEKTSIAIEIAEELTRDIQIALDVSVVTESNNNKDLGTMSGHNSFPFSIQIDITWRDDRDAETYIETIVHELTHAYAHRMGFLRNTVSGNDLDNIDEAYSGVSGALASNLWNYRKKIEELMKKFLEKPTDD